MKSVFRALLTSLCLLLITHGFSQNPYPKTLLWRISGNGLQKPSYLFGTMHLNDERLFRFDDSLYHALEISQGLAIEINPDEMAAYELNKVVSELQKGKNIKDLLGKKDYERYGKKLSKKLNKPISDITERDLIQEKNKWVGDYLAKGEMPTFVDAYLYSTAKRQGKWVGGIEDVSDQAGIIDMVDKSDIELMVADDSKDQYDRSLEHMIDLYTRQDLQGISDMTNHSDSAFQDLVLIKRNGKMSRRIDSLAHERNMLFAIGAAHLPGDSGVIALLRKRGFTVTPVMGVSKLNAKDYKYTEVPQTWSDVKDKQSLYTVSMPGNPTFINIQGIMEMPFLMDFTSYSGYSTWAMTSPYNLSNNDSVYNVFTDKVFVNQKVKGVPITKNGISGKEFSGVVDFMQARVQMYFTPHVIYACIYYTLKKDSLQGMAAKKFFSSFTMQLPKASNNPLTRLRADTSEDIAFLTPDILKYEPSLSSQNSAGWEISTRSGADPTTGIYTMQISKNPINGNYIANDSLMFNQMLELVKKQFDIRQYAIKETVDYKGRYIEGQNKNYAARVLTLIRYNQFFALMVLGDSALIHTASSRQNGRLK